jgi:Protein of unknown function (DUF2752)
MVAKIRLLVMFLIPIILLLLPTTFFDSGKSVCLSIALFNQECFGCGITRGIMHLIHFDFEGAAYYNFMSFVILPLMMFAWSKIMWQDYKSLLSSK